MKPFFALAVVPVLLIASCEPACDPPVSKPGPTTTVAPPTTTQVRPPTTPAGPGPDGLMFAETFDTDPVAGGRVWTDTWHRSLEIDSGGHDYHGTWMGDHDMECNGADTQRVVRASADARDPEAFGGAHVVTPWPETTS